MLGDDSAEGEQGRGRKSGHLRPVNYTRFVAPLLGEFVGTMLLIILGDGVVANVLLAKCKGQNSGWIVITTGWALAVFVAVAAFAHVSGAHINPAVTIALAAAGVFSWSMVPGYIAAQMLGAFAGAVVVWLAYLPHWKETEGGELKRAVFCTAPAIYNPPANFVCEVIGTFVLIFAVLTFKGVYEHPLSGAAIPIDLGAMGAIPIALVVWAIGLSLGGPTGYAINPARDLGPRLAHAILPIPGKAGNDWRYAWIPVVAPIVGALLAVVVWLALGKFPSTP
jgi:glycerol uptake facilitator protein